MLSPFTLARQLSPSMRYRRTLTAGLPSISSTAVKLISVAPELVSFAKRLTLRLAMAASTSAMSIFSPPKYQPPSSPSSPASSLSASSGGRS